MAASPARSASREALALRLAAAGLIAAPAARWCASSVLGLAVALLGAMLLFIGHSLQTMTGSAVRCVPLDWQGPVGVLSTGRPGGACRRRASGGSPMPTRPPRRRSRRLRTAGRAASRTPAAGALFAVDNRLPGRPLHLPPAARTVCSPGRSCSTSSWRQRCRLRSATPLRSAVRAGRPPMRLRVSGVALITAPDTVFQPLNPTAGPAPAQPPANAAIMRPRHLRATRRARAADDPQRGRRARPPSRAAQSGVQWQVQAQLDPAPSPAARATRTRGGTDPASGRAQPPRPGPVRRQPLRFAQHGGRRRALRRDAVHHARRPGRHRRPRARLSGRARDAWTATAATSRCCACAAARAGELLAPGRR